MTSLRRGILESPQQSAPALSPAGGVTQGGKSLSTPNCTPSTTFIYALADPRTGRVRYVGKANDPEQRLAQHRHGDGRNGHKNNWIRQLRRAGLCPVLHILQECADDWADRERYWIAYHRAAGEPLTNLTEGGEGASGRALSDDVKAQLSASAKAAWANLETRTRQVAAMHSESSRARMSATHKATWEDPEHRAKMAAIRKASWEDPEVRENRSAGLKESWSNPDVRARHSAGSSAAQSSPEYRDRMSAAVRAAKATPEGKANHSAGVRKAWIARRAKAANAASKEIS